MIKILTLSLSLVLFSACSLPDFKTHPNAWQHKSANAFNSYTKNFLSNNNALAESDLKRATQHAKSSANLSSLARIYLGECALNISVGSLDNCAKYNDISNLVNSKKLDVYNKFINNNLQKNEINLLPKNYQTFALHVANKNYNDANKDILDMKKVTSQLLSAILIKDNLEKFILIKEFRKNYYFHNKH